MLGQAGGELKIRIVSAVVLCLCFLITACSGSRLGDNSEKKIVY